MSQPSAGDVYGPTSQTPLGLPHHPCKLGALQALIPGLMCKDNCPLLKTTPCYNMFHKLGQGHVCRERPGDLDFTFTSATKQLEI